MKIFFPVVKIVPCGIFSDKESVFIQRRSHAILAIHLTFQHNLIGDKWCYCIYKQPTEQGFYTSTL